MNEFVPQQGRNEKRASKPTAFTSRRSDSPFNFGGPIFKNSSQLSTPVNTSSNKGKWKHTLLKIPNKLTGLLPSKRKHKVLTRMGWGFMAVLMLSTIFMDSFIWWQDTTGYALSAQAETVLPAAQADLANSIKRNDTAGSFDYNVGATLGGNKIGQSMAPRFSASISYEAKKGITVTDLQNQISITVKPEFGLADPQQNQNRIVYPVRGKDAQKVYTLQVANIKEDIILNSYQKDKMEFSYELGLPSGTEARMEQDGSVGIYGAELSLLGNVTTSSEKDEKLLDKARRNAEKTNLLFRIPAPFVVEKNHKQSSARAWLGLEGSTLTIFAAGLKDASYPLSIDPTIYIETASKLMRGNNESNIDFDIDNELIQKGKTTGGRFDSWTSSLALPAARWRHATAVAGGYAYVMGGNNGTSNVGNMYWAKFNTTTGALEAPNPGSGACASWCTNTAYDLPSSQVRAGSSMVAYNGYLYLLGGLDSAGTTTNSVYISKLGANGEPQLWHPSDNNKSNWTYWYQDANLSSSVAFTGAAAYNNRLYLLGGSTTGVTGGTTTVQVADINPFGSLANWTTLSGSPLPASRMSLGVQIYNDRIYAIGGSSGTTTANTVYYNKINTDGTLNTWNTTTAISNNVSAGNRASVGGEFTTVWGGFIYVAAGCNVLNASGHCTSISSDIQLASINADGTVSDWTTVLGVTNSRIGYGLAAWRNRVYGVGGCTAQNTTTGACTTTATVANYGSINQDGDVSTVSTSVASGTSPCVTTGWTDCDLPPEGDGNGQSGRMAGATVVNNGYIYYMGGCTAVNSSSVCFTGNAGKATDNISYAAITADGNITRIAACTGGTFVGSWCVMNNASVLGEKLAAFSYALYNNTLYIIGGTTGTDWQANVWRTTFNNDGTWGAWSSQTFAALGLGNAKGYTYAFTRANPGSAGTYPANLYVMGGCSGVTAADSGLDCTGTLYTDVYKCFIKTDASLETSGSPCTTTGQLQIDSEPNTGGNQGLGVMAGAVYANYVYMIGGQSINESERGSVMYAKIDNNNNIVAATGSIWITSGSAISPVRRRGMAFGYNGYIYALAGYNSGGGGSLQDLLYAKVNVSDGSIGTFTTSTVTVTARWDLRGVVNNGYVYAIGGCSTGAPPASCTAMTGTVQTFQLYNNYSGSPKLYNAGNQYTTDRYGSSAAVLNGYMYLAGGCTTTTDCTDATNSVQYAALGADGVLGTWAAGGNLPADRAWGQLEVAGGTLYYLGGQDDAGTAQSTVYYTSSFSSGNPTWNGSAATGGIGDTSGQAAQVRTKFGAVSWNNRMYVVAGIGSGGTRANTVFISPQINSGGNINADSWTSDGDTLNVARSGNALVAYANNLYSFGGFDGTNYFADSQLTQINSDGTIDAWSYTTSLPAVLDGADGFAANGFMYLFGGRSTATTCRSNTISAPISANTTIASGNNPTGIGDWYGTNVRYSGDRYGAATVYDQGRAYVMGGMCNGTLVTTTNRLQYSTLQSQPQVAKYSRMIDTDKDVFPTVWLMNGLDNSTGARWFMRYRSMTDPLAASGQKCKTPDMTTWGQDTNFGEVTLGKVQTYTPKDSGGTTTNCARYFYMLVTIDSQQAYGYPEDVTRGPTIADLSLFYTASPSQRLIHGKTFTGGEQQPLDTPCRRSNNGSDPLYAECPLP